MLKKLNEKINSSIYTLLSIYIIFILLICLMIFSLSNYLSFSLIKDTSEHIEVNSYLYKFYQECDIMDSSARTFLYSKDKVDYDNYVNAFNESSDILSKIASIIPESKNRLSYLNNMLLSYDEYLNTHIESVNSSNIYEISQNLIYLNQLIKETQLEYNEYLNTYLRSKLNKISTNWKTRTTLLFLLIVFVAINVLIFEFKLFEKITKPIKIMVSNINNIAKGNYNIRHSNTEIREYKILAESIDLLAKDVSEKIYLIEQEEKLKRTILEQSNENLKIKNLLVQAEVKVLQMQINPHFLFNTINMISQYAYLDGKTEITELMNRFSNVLRYAIEKTNKQSTIMNEITYIKDYLFIQKKRFKDQFNFKINIEDNITNIELPALIIQPLVENSIQHGLQNRATGAEIVIMIFNQTINGKDYLQIEVEDNGIGMNCDKLEELFTTLDRVKDSNISFSNKHIGLINVYKRLYMFWGRDLIFNIESEEDCGTIVTIMIPLEQ